jgi:TonB family protein
MLPVFRWCLCGLGALSSCAALAQAAASQPEVDESKIPEWVKRQARSPYKVIIESNAVKAKPAPAPAPAKDEASAKATPKKPPVKTVTPAAPEADKAVPPLASNTAASAPAGATSARPLASTAPAEAAAALQPPVSESVALPPPTAAALSTRAAPTEPAPLTLVKRVEPTLTADLLDSRLSTAKVVVAFTVTANGEVANLSVASTSDPRLNRSVLRAVQAWRYAPIPEPREHMVSFAFTTE